MKSILLKFIVTIFSILCLAAGGTFFAAAKEKTSTPEVRHRFF